MKKGSCGHTNPCGSFFLSRNEVSLCRESQNGRAVTRAVRSSPLKADSTAPNTKPKKTETTTVSAATPKQRRCIAAGGGAPCGSSTLRYIRSARTACLRAEQRPPKRCIISNLSQRVVNRIRLITFVPCVVHVI